MKNSKALWTVLALISVALILVALAGQVVSARPASYELKPPFKFAQLPATSRPEVDVVPPGSTVLMTETFGAAFTATTSLVGSTPLWRVTTNTDDTAGYYWSNVGVSAPVTFTNSAWSAARLYTATQVLTPGVSTYPAGQDTWLIYGPFDASDDVYVHLGFESYLDSQAGDTLSWAMSSDGQNFFGDTISGSPGEWITNTHSFRAHPSYTGVYVAFAFHSSTNPQGLGAFIRNVRLTGEPIKYNYLPLVNNNYAEPTATPTPTPTPVPPLYGYTFDPGNTTNLAQWGGAYKNPGTTKYGQCVPGQIPEQCPHYTTPHGNPANSLRLFTNGTYSFVASSPNDVAPDDYDLYVDISPWVIYPKAGCSPYGCPSNDLGDWYGIIFNASNDGTFGATPNGFQYLSHYYRLYFYNADSVKPIAIQLDRCSGNSDYSCHQLAVNSLPNTFIGNASGFDTVHIQRLASGSIQVWLNGSSVLTAWDNSYTTSKGFGKYGALIFSWTQNATQNPPTGYEMQVDFDNINLYQH